MNMDTQFATIDKTTLHNQEKIMEFLDKFSADFGKIEMIFQRKIRYQPDKVLLEIKMETTDGH